MIGDVKAKNMGLLGEFNVLTTILVLSNCFLLYMTRQPPIHTSACSRVCRH
jgi:hypothetical protein